MVTRRRSMSLMFSAALLVGTLQAGDLKVGAGKVVITPTQSIWLAGYAARKAPSEGTVHDLYAKALAFEDETQARAVLLTMDLLGLPASLANQVAKLAREKHNVPRERLMITFSHTHSGPVIQGDKIEDMYGLDETQQRVVREYSEKLPDMLVQAIGEALANLEPCRVEWGVGRAGFAINRRQYTLDGIIIGLNPIGPVDHDVPVLKVSRNDGSLKAVLFGYACHNTTLDFLKICGDYAGFAQVYVEEQLPGTMALFVAGCGADANPHPRRTLELAQQHGKTLGEAVRTALAGPFTQVRGPLRTAYQEVALALTPPPTREELEKQLADKNIYVQRRAKRLLAQLDQKGAIATQYSYPVQVWQFAGGPIMTALGGEVVVDYSLLFKHEFGRDRTWVIGYANDFCSYIPSLRVLREGGYEGGDSMMYFGFHGPWAPTIERDITGTVQKLVEQTKP
jgi:neutral ceramidase